MWPAIVASNTSAVIQTTPKHFGSWHSQKNAIGSRHANDPDNSRIVVVTMRIEVDSRPVSETPRSPV